MGSSGPPGVGFVDGNSNQSNGSRNSDELLHGVAGTEASAPPAREPPPPQTGSAEKKTPGERRRKRKNQDALHEGGGRGVILDGGVKPQAAKKINEYFNRNAPGSPGAQAQGK